MTRPTSSTAAGRSSSVTTVASIASMRLLKWTAMSAVALGRGSRLTFASVTAASVPSEPTIILARLNPSSSMIWSRLYPPTRRMTFG